MAAGALSLGAVATLNWDFVVNSIKKVVSVITGILSGALIVLGVIVQRPCRIRQGQTRRQYRKAKTNTRTAQAQQDTEMMAAGALSLGAVATLNWGFVVNSIKKVVSGITGQTRRQYRKAKTNTRTAQAQQDTENDQCAAENTRDDRYDFLNCTTDGELHHWTCERCH